MPKKSAVLNPDVAAVIERAEAAANAIIAPPENQAIGQLAKTALDETPPPTTPDTDEQDNPAIAEIDEARTMKRNQLVIAKDVVKMIDAQLKELDEQWLDAVKCKPKLYKKLQQAIFPY